MTSTSTGKHATIRTCSFQELMEMDLPRREHLIIPWLRQGESTMVFAAPGVGKSLFALDIALSVAGGGKCIGLWQTGPYMEEEQDEEATERRGVPAALKCEGSQTEEVEQDVPSAPNFGEYEHDTSCTTDALHPLAFKVEQSDKSAPCRCHGWKVLYVDGEMPLDDIRDRAAMLARGKMKEEGFSLERAGRNLHFMARHHQKDVLADFVDLADHDSRCELLERIRRDNIDLVILDNLSTLAAFEDENAASSFNGPIDFLQRLKSGKTACLLVHHTNKGGEEFRGSSRIATTFETLVLLKTTTPPPFEAEEEERCEGEEAEPEGETTTSAFTLEWRKFRGRRDDSVRDGMVFALTTTTTMTTAAAEEETTSTTGRSGESVARWKITDKDVGLMWQMLELVRSETCATQKELAEALQVSAPTLSRMKQRVMREGRITDREWRERLKAAEKRRRGMGANDSRRKEEEEQAEF